MTENENRNTKIQFLDGKKLLITKVITSLVKKNKYVLIIYRKKPSLPFGRSNTFIPKYLHIKLKYLLTKYTTAVFFHDHDTQVE